MGARMLAPIFSLVVFALLGLVESQPAPVNSIQLSQTTQVLGNPITLTFTLSPNTPVGEIAIFQLSSTTDTPPGTWDKGPFGGNATKVESIFTSCPSTLVDARCSLSNDGTGSAYFSISQSVLNTTPQGAETDGTLDYFLGFRLISTTLITPNHVYSPLFAFQSSDANQKPISVAPSSSAGSNFISTALFPTTTGAPNTSTQIFTTYNPGQANKASTAMATATTSLLSATPAGIGQADSTAVSGIVVSSSNTGLSTGAKAGIGAGAGAFVLFVIAALIFFFRRRRNKSSLDVSPGVAYSNEMGSTSRDLQEEKEAAVIASTVNYEPVPRQRRSDIVPQVGGFTQVQHQQAGGLEPTQDQQAVASLWSPSPLSREEPRLATYHDTSQHSRYVPELLNLHEPGMSAEEIARLIDEERRIDEAIAEAERRR